MHWDYWGQGYGMGIGGWFMIVFWIALIVLGAWLVATLLRGGTRTSGSDAPTALDILKRRYAQGEISKDEYEQRKRDLLG